MAKTVSKTAAAAKKMKKPAATLKANVPFGQWAKEIARARGEAAVAIGAIRDHSKVTVKSTLDTAKKLFPGHDFSVVERRYNDYLKRGSQAA